MFYLNLPLIFLRFWFLDTPKVLILFFSSLNKAFLELFSLPVLLRTYFKPWKNEYREGLVGFSVAMGMSVKTPIIIADIILLLALLLIEAIFLLGFILLPISTLVFLFGTSFYRAILFPVSLIFILFVFLLFKSKRSFSEIALSKKHIADIIKFLLKQKEINFLLQKADIKKEEISLIEIQKDTVANTPLDFFVSYLMSTEEQTKLLFNHKLKKEDLLNIAYWAKKIFPENKKPWRIKFWGEGVVEYWTYGWTLETKKYMVDITSEALNVRSYLLGRENELKQLIAALSQNESVLLVGDPGSGKNAMVEALALMSFSGEMRGNLYHQRIFKLYTDTLLAGAKDQGELEKRLGNIISEISHSGNVIIYIADFENVLGTSSFKIDLSGVLIPYLKDRTIRIIATVSTGAYRKFIEPSLELMSVLEIIKLPEPDQQTALYMLLDRAASIERQMKVKFSYRSILAALNYSGKYLIDRILPGRAVLLLQDSANEVRIAGKKEVLEEDVVRRVEEKTKIHLEAPQGEERKLILNLESKMHESLIDQEEAVVCIAEGIRRIRSGLQISAKPISFLFLGPTGVGKTKTAKVLSSLYFNGEKNMMRFDMSEYSSGAGVERFIGSGIGLENEGIAGKIHENPSSLVLLDEFEKADPAIHNLFLQILDDGRLTDNNGKTVSFANAIIIVTSNAGTEFIREEIGKGLALDKNFKDKFLGYLLSKNIFRPELLNRFDDIVVFKPLGMAEVIQVTKLLLEEVSEGLLAKDIALNFDEETISKIAKEGFDEQFGARPLRRFIQDNIEDLIAQKILKNQIKRGDKVLISVDPTSNLQVTISN